MIITVVIGGMLQLFSNNNRFFLTMDSKIDMAYNASLLLGVKESDFESRGISLDDLVRDFNVDDDLRRMLKEVKVTVEYREVMRLDSADLEAEAEAMADEPDSLGTETAETGLEVGRMSMHYNGLSSSFLRLKLP